MAEAEEGLEDVEALGIEIAVVVHAEEEGAGAFEFGVVEGALGAFEFDDDFFLDAGREVAGDLGVVGVHGASRPAGRASAGRGGR